MRRLTKSDASEIIDALKTGVTVLFDNQEEPAIETPVIEQESATEPTTTTIKFNKSSIFKNAWVLVKSLGLSIGEALKKSWAQAKGLVSISQELIIV
jgi:hypothetical protein